ncbi:set domain-containing protein [Stemphylium lycopersici]|nr:set domain-containing protein [Stemphylium lycopersici]
MADFDGASQAFLAWLRQNGAEISPKIQLEDLRNRDAGRGVVATQSIAEHELLFRIPRASILSVENSILSTEIPAATFSLLGPWLSLILVMLYEYHNGTASNWAPYFAVLPNDFNTLMFWSEDELAELQASAVVGKIGKESADDMFIEQLLPVIEEFADVVFSGDERAKDKAKEMRAPENLELMHKMGSLIMAYAFDLEPAVSDKEVDDEGFAEEEEDAALPKGMVPLADMLNADAERCNARLFYEKDGLEMKALKPIQAGEEVLNDYGPLPRSDLLRRYGYVTDNYAQYDVVEIPADLVSEILAKHGSWYDDRAEYLDEQEIIDTGYDIAASTPFTLQESFSPELVILVETMLLLEEDFERLQSKGKLPKPEKMTAKGAEVLHQIVQARIAQYTTTLDQDLQISKEIASVQITESKQRRIAMAVAVRGGEKTLLAQAREALAEKIARDGGATTKRARDVDEEGDVEMGGTGKKHRA